VAALLVNFDTHQLTAIAEFMARCTDLAYHHAALLRAVGIPTKPNAESGMNPNGIPG
jgi:hypothetical protein